MTIHGIGIDLLFLPRVAGLVKRRGASRLASRILSPSERTAFCRLWSNDLVEQVTSMDAATRFLGVRWAVKEAAYKALYPHRPTWKELTYTSFDAQTGSKPGLIFHPNGGDITVSDQRPRLHVSVSHDGEYIFAYVVAEDEA